MSSEKEKLLTADILRTLLHYDPATGIFTWIKKRAGVTVGAIAGYKNVAGYWAIKIGTVKYFAHRLAWLYVNGVWPGKWLDHINRNPADNRIENLREATPEQNSANRKLSRTNTSGFMGVSLDRQSNKYRAAYRRGDRLIVVGSFKTAEEASLAYQAAIAYRGAFNPSA